METTAYEKMTALANEVRELSGKTEAMGIDAMTNTLSTENNNFNINLTAQDDLITQIETALEGKIGGGGSGLETCSVTINTSALSPTPAIFFYTDGLTITNEFIEVTGNTILTVLKNTIMVIQNWNMQSYDSGLCDRIFYQMGYAAYRINGDCTFTFSGG